MEFKNSDQKIIALKQGLSEHSENIKLRPSEQLEKLALTLHHLESNFDFEIKKNQKLEYELKQFKEVYECFVSDAEQRINTAQMQLKSEKEEHKKILSQYKANESKLLDKMNELDDEVKSLLIKYKKAEENFSLQLKNIENEYQKTIGVQQRKDIKIKEYQAKISQYESQESKLYEHIQKIEDELQNYILQHHEKEQAFNEKKFLLELKLKEAQEEISDYPRKEKKYFEQKLELENIIVNNNEIINSLNGKINQIKQEKKIEISELKKQYDFESEAQNKRLLLTNENNRKELERLIHDYERKNDCTRKETENKLESLIQQERASQNILKKELENLKLEHEEKLNTEKQQERLSKNILKREMEQLIEKQEKQYSNNLKKMELETEELKKSNEQISKELIRANIEIETLKKYLEESAKAVDMPPVELIKAVPVQEKTNLVQEKRTPFDNQSSKQILEVIEQTIEKYQERFYQLEQTNPERKELQEKIADLLIQRTELRAIRLLSSL